MIFLWIIFPTQVIFVLVVLEILFIRFLFLLVFVQDSVNPKKIKLLTSAIDFYVTNSDLDVEVRFDIIAIITNKKETKIEHLEDAFLHF